MTSHLLQYYPTVVKYNQEFTWSDLQQARSCFDLAGHVLLLIPDCSNCGNYVGALHKVHEQICMAHSGKTSQAHANGCACNYGNAGMSC